jgi:hypothetical protein
MTPAKWELKSGLIGFTWLNNAHNGEQLGQALFKIIKCVGIERRISVFYITSISIYCLLQRLCDNASNNLTMYDKRPSCAFED